MVVAVTVSMFSELLGYAATAFFPEINAALVFCGRVSLLLSFLFYIRDGLEVWFLKNLFLSFEDLVVQFRCQLLLKALALILGSCASILLVC